jgi:hypothetical protein
MEMWFVGDISFEEVVVVPLNNLSFTILALR